MAKDKNVKLVALPLITEEQLKAVYPNCKPEKIKSYAAAFNAVFPLFGIDTPARIAAFLGQVGVESGELRYDKELPSSYNKKDPKDPKEPIGTLYEGRKNLGNTVAGDGPRFIGRGVLQLTGRANYADMSKKIGIDIVASPEKAAEADVSTRIACQYFKDRGLLELADKWNLDEITRRVNGNAKLHLAERIAYSEKAVKILTA
jgi:putative chitinase